jgi:hypothetical protein
MAAPKSGDGLNRWLEEQGISRGSYYRLLREGLTHEEAVEQAAKYGCRKARYGNEIDWSAGDAGSLLKSWRKS